MSEMAKLRRHYYNVVTGEHVFSIDKPVGNEWVNKAPNSGKGKEKGYKFWAYNPETGDQRAFVKGSEIPTGWVRGRLKDSTFNGFSDINKKTRVFDFISKSYIMIDPCDKFEPWQEMMVGFRITDSTPVYIVGNKISLSAERLVPMLKYRKLTTIVTDHWNASEEMKLLAKTHLGKTLREAFDVKEIPLKEFEYDRKYTTTKPK